MLMAVSIGGLVLYHTTGALETQAENNPAAADVENAMDSANTVFGPMFLVIIIIIVAFLIIGSMRMFRGAVG